MRKANPSRRSGPFGVRLAWGVLAVAAVLAFCGLTLYWTQTKVNGLSEQMAAMDRNLKALTAEASAGKGVTADPVPPAEGVAAATQSSTAEVVRLGHVVKCAAAGNVVTVTYDPAQLFTGEDAVRLAASKGDAVVGGVYIFDPSRDTFTGDSPVKTKVIVHQAPSGWDGSSPTTVTELADILQGALGQKWAGVYFWLHFNEGYIVSIEQFQTGDSQ